MMNIKTDRNFLHLKSAFLIYTLLFIAPFGLHAELTLSGPIVSENANITGSIIISSMTIASATITDLQVNGTVNRLPGTVVQMQYSSSTLVTEVTVSTFVAVSTLTISLSNIKNYLRISVTGVFSVTNKNSFGVLTVKRDDVDLGHPDGNGLAYIDSPELGQIWRPVGVVFVDFPGTTSPLNYTVCIKADQSAGSNIGAFPRSVGYFVIEEIAR
jgi:hypothetical protein